MADAVMQFYDKEDRFDFGTTSNNLQAFRNAVELADGDCRKLEQTGEEYLNCAHVIPEVWTARSEQVQQYIREGILDAPLGLGALGIEGWYIPKFTAEQHPDLTSWVGMQANRQLLAETFLRPTKWKDYCDQISPTNCLEDDGVATRPPADENEESRLYKDGAYIGHFRKTAENDCELNPTNCTGHIGDFPCGWGGALEATCHHLDIGLESNGDEPNSGGWTYGQLGQMWRAANATRNHVAMMWVVPDPLYEEFMGTEYEFVKVTLPAATQTCVKNKINPENRCSDDPALRLGDALGVCDETARPLYKLLLADLYDLTQGPSIPEALHSPAYSVVSSFSLTELQINDMFRYWQIWGSPREAICQWTVDNFEDLQQFIPRSYPRMLQETHSDVLLYVTCTLGGIAFLFVVATMVLVYFNKQRRAFRYAQIEFLYLLLVGSILVAIGGILHGLQVPSDATCIAQSWLIGLGYTFELVPLLVKVAAINRLMQAAQRMRRVELKRSTLYGGVVLISLLVTIFLICWTTLDPPQKRAEYELSDQTADDQFETTIIDIQYFCQSSSPFWEYVALTWNAVLILCATALAFQSRSVKQHFNESRVLSRMIYSHFVFVLLRVMAFFFEPSVANPMLSIIFSLDTMFMILIYFAPKFLSDDRTGVLANGGTSTHVSGAYLSEAQVGRSSHASIASFARTSEVLPNKSDHGSHAAGSSEPLSAKKGTERSLRPSGQSTQSVRVGRRGDGSRSASPISREDKISESETEDDSPSEAFQGKRISFDGSLS